MGDEERQKLLSEIERYKFMFRTALIGLTIQTIILVLA
jgi:hypothetical protein